MSSSANFPASFAAAQRCWLRSAKAEGILIGAADAELLGDVLGGLRHRVDAVLLLHQLVDEAPADGGVVDLVGTREGGRRLGHHERGPRHALDPTGKGEVDLAGADRTGDDADRVHARTAETVDRRAGHVDRQAGKQRRHARDVAVVLAGLVGAAIDRVVERGPVEVGMALDQRLDRQRREIVGADTGEPAAVAADRGAHGIADEGVGHGRVS
jgi:hypothetical protein